MRIACIGDSCTFGQNVRADQAWPHILWELTGHDVRNLGVNGDTTRLGLERWHRDIDLLEPDLVVIQFGHNDCNEWHDHPRVSPAEYEANVNEMFRRSLAAIIIDPWPADPERQPGFNARLKKYGIIRPNKGAPTPSYGLRPEILDDGYGVHPSPEGHRTIAEYVRGLL